MKKAVNSFIEAVGEKYNANADHRMAIVTFSTGASTLQGWTYVDDDGKTTLTNKINGLPNSPSGATNAGAGMERAESLMGSAGNNRERQKVVVFFTDGIPTTDSQFDTSVADNAIESAKRLKDAGVTVYSVGIFNGADPNEMYGASGFDTNSDGTEKSKWIKDAWGLFPGTDFPEADRPAGNRFLNYLSSNSSNAQSVGLTRDTSGWGIVHYKITYTITKNYDRIANNYYLTAKDSDSLNEIFQTISNNIQTADISLDSATVVKDIVSPYFNVPADANNIKVYTAACEGKDKWGKDEEVSSLTVDITNDTVSVTGFDFNENFVTEDLKEDGTRGKKLIIEFTVTAKDDFLGGNDVITNASAGIYENSSATTPVRTFEQPKVNVPIQDVTVTAQDKNVYLLGEVTADQLKNSATVNVGDVALNLGESNYGLADWQTAYVDITVVVKDAAGNVVDDKIANLDNDTTYTIEVTVAPKNPGTTTPEKGTAATAKSDNDEGAINVFKPELTFKDSKVEYKKSVLNGTAYTTLDEYFEATNRVGTDKKVVWKHEGNTLPEGQKMTGEEPTLDLTYTPESGKIVNNIVESTTDIPVKVEVKIGTADVTSNTTFVHQECNLVDNCQWTAPTEKGNPAFRLHVINVVGDLTITKTGLNQHTYAGAEDQESAIFRVTGNGVNMTVVVNCEGDSRTGSVTIANLPAGTYTVEEVSGWTWRYTVQGDNPRTNVEVIGGSSDNKVEFTNTQTNNKWLGGDNYKNNVFSSGN